MPRDSNPNAKRCRCLRLVSDIPTRYDSRQERETSLLIIKRSSAWCSGSRRLLGSALLMNGPIPKGTLGEMLLATVFGKVNAHIEFLHRGAKRCATSAGIHIHHDGCTSSQHLQKALEEMNTSDSSDATITEGSLNEAFDRLRQSIRQLSGMLNSKRRTRP